MPCERDYGTPVIRLGLIVINILFMYWRIERVNSLSTKDANDSCIHFERANLTVMILDVALNVIFILAAYVKNMRLLKISLIGNAASLMVFSMYSLSMICYYLYSLYAQYQVSVRYKYIKPLFRNLGVVTSGASIEILISYAMFLLYNEIKELDTNNFLFRFVNTASEAKCEMQWEEQNKTAEEAKEEDDTLNKRIVGTEEGTEVISKPTCDYPLNNVIETKCTIEC